MKRLWIAAAAAMVLAALPDISLAQQQEPPPGPPPPNNNCRNTGSFESWLAGFRQDAVKAGISARTIAAVLDGMTIDHNIISRDRKQSFFAQSFLSFADKLTPRSRLENGLAKLKQHHDLFARVEREYGVQGPVITAFWALESDFGSVVGNLPVLRSLATLAYDCRRGEFFRYEFMEALRIVDRGDLTPGEMVGSWAGELGQTQFLPAHYLRYAVDYDGDGRRNLIRSVPDVIASSANFLKALGWQAGQPWLQEVRVPANLPWDQADLAIQHPQSQWAAWGVKLADGKALPPGDMPASLILPMGRFGPSFLAYPNFQVYLKWNQSLTYSLTAAYLATRFAGAPAMHRGTGPVPDLSFEQVKELQQILARSGYDVGEADGKIGAATRAAVKTAQLKLGLPADSYPTPELIERLRARR